MRNKLEIVSIALGIICAIALSVRAYQDTGYAAPTTEVAMYAAAFAALIYVGAKVLNRILNGEGSKPVYWGDKEEK